MKKLSLFIIGAILSINVFAQGVGTSIKPKLAVLNFDIVGGTLNKDQFISITRSEVAKIGDHQVLDKYSIGEAFEKQPVDLDKCFGTQCLTAAGKQLETKFVVAGAVEVINDKAIVTLRLIDVDAGSSIKTSYSEFLWTPENAQSLIEIAVKKLFDKEVEPNKFNVYDYSIAKRGGLEGPQIQKYNLSGPRFGATYQTGEMGDVLQASKDQGGFDKMPFMTVIGYQYEKQYLYTGKFQAVFQMNFSLAGLDQQLAVPSFTVLNGFRSTKSGWEFGFGPSFRLRRTAEGFYRNDAQGNKVWHLLKDAEAYENPAVEERLDSRGSINIFSSWIWGVGKSFKAGSMNIPVNFYTIPDKDGWMFGVSMGYAIHH